MFVGFVMFVRYATGDGHARAAPYWLAAARPGRHLNTLQGSIGTVTGAVLHSHRRAG